MMIQAVLGNPNHPEYGVATIPFPIPRDQYAHCIYIHFPVHCEPSTPAEEKNLSKLPSQLCSKPLFIAFFNFSHKRPTFAFPGESAHTRLRQQDRTQLLTRRNGERFEWGRYLYPRSVLRGSETLRGQGVEQQTLPLLGLGQGCSRRTQRAFGTAMRLCASLFRGVAAPLGCVIR